MAEDPKPAIYLTSSKANTDSGYHGMSDDEMDVDKPTDITQPILEPQSLEEALGSPKLPADAQKISRRHLEEQSTTDSSYSNAKENDTSREACKTGLQPNGNLELTGEPVVASKSTDRIPSLTLPSVSAVVLEDVMDLDEIDRDSVLDDIPVDESRSPSQGSSPAKPLVRKSSLTFASLPAREPLTTKKSIGSRVSRTSQLDLSRPTVSRGSLLGRFTGGKSLGGIRQPEAAPGNNDNDEAERDEAGRPEIAREQSDGDAKMAKLHSKSSTQRLHDKINMLGKSQPARPTKSIPAAAALPNTVYPELPVADTRGHASVVASGACAKTSAIEVPEDDDDDWIGPPQLQSSDSNRPKLSKSTSVDVMEDIRGKHNISDQEFGFERHIKEQNREPSPLRQSVMADSQNFGSRQSRSASSSTFVSPTRVGLRSETKIMQMKVSNPERQQSPNQSTTPNGTPTKRYVDGPLSASKSKLQSIMKTARGLFTSSAGVSAQAKMETLSPHSMQTHGQVRDSPGGSFKVSKVKPSGLNGELYPDLGHGGHIETSAEHQLHSSAQNAEPRKLRSSTERTEKEEKRREVEERGQHLGDSELRHARNTQDQKAGKKKQENITTVLAEPQMVESVPTTRSKVDQPSMPIRKSPRRLQNQQDSKQPMEASENRTNAIADEAGPAQVMGPPPLHHQSQSSQLQKPKDMRRPIKPAKEAAPKPKPQPVAIRVGTLSQRIPLTNAALSSSLQESLPPSQPKPSNLGKKPSNASLHPSASNSSLKSSVTSTTAKPKALLAAERKREQVSKVQ